MELSLPESGCFASVVSLLDDPFHEDLHRDGLSTGAEYAQGPH